MHLKLNKSFTLIELLIAAYILLVGICGILLLFVNTMTSMESSWDTTVASSHAESVLEDMQNKKALGDIIAIDWDAWAEKQGFKTLPQESFHIIYDSVAANPLDVQVVVEWKRKNALKNVVLETKITR